MKIILLFSLAAATSVLSAQSAGGFSIGSVTLSPGDSVPEGTALEMTVNVITPNMPGYLYAPTQVSLHGVNSNFVRVNIYPTSGMLTALDSFNETADLGTLPAGHYFYEVVLHPEYPVNWGVRTNQGSFHIFGPDVPPGNHSPVVNFHTPIHGQTFTAPATIRLQAFAQDEDGDEVVVEFFSGTNRLGAGEFVPSLCPAPVCPYYEFVWTNVPPGQYTLRARATDIHGVATGSDPVHILVEPEYAIITITATQPHAVEPDGSTPAVPGIFTVTREGRTNTTTTVVYEILGSAANDIDYQFIMNRVVFSRGQTSAEIQILPLADNEAEGAETVRLRLLEPNCCYRAAPPGEAVVYISDSQGPGNPPPTVIVTAPDAIASEGTNCWCRIVPHGSAGPAHVHGTNNIGVFRIARSGPTNAALTVFYSLGGTASNGLDYVELPGYITIEPGRRAARVGVVPIDDDDVERYETVILRLAPSTDDPAAYAIGRASRAGVIILDSDCLPPRTAMLSDRSFHLSLPATNGQVYRVEVSDDLVEWRPLFTDVVEEGGIHFVDSEAAEHPARFYRVVPETGP